MDGRGMGGGGGGRGAGAMMVEEEGALIGGGRSNDGDRGKMILGERGDAKRRGYVSVWKNGGEF